MPSETNPIVVLGLPSYDGWRMNMRAVIDALQSGYQIHYIESSMSLLACCFNVLLASALNLRSKEATHFVMLHADVVPEPGWLKILMREADRTKSALLSVVIPMKIDGGDTSTAVETEDGWRPRRLSWNDVRSRPQTWTEPGLLVNSGCMLLDLRMPWVHNVKFTISDRIVQRDGAFSAECVSEDWNFSRQVRLNGGSVYATTAVAVTHHGEHPFAAERNIRVTV